MLLKEEKYQKTFDQNNRSELKNCVCVCVYTRNEENLSLSSTMPGYQCVKLNWETVLGSRVGDALELI